MASCQELHRAYHTFVNINGCPYMGNIFTVKIILQLYVKIILHLKNPCSRLSHDQFSFSLWLWLEYFTFFFFQKSHLVSFVWTVFKTFYQRPQRPRWPPLSGPLCPWLAPRLPPCALPPTDLPPLVRVLALAGTGVAGQRARAAAAAGRVWAAKSAVAPLPRPFSWQAQGLAQQTPVLLSCWPVRRLRRLWPGSPSASWRQPCWHWRSGGLRRLPRCWSRPRLSGPEVGTRQNQRR